MTSYNSKSFCVDNYPRPDLFTPKKPCNFSRIDKEHLKLLLVEPVEPQKKPKKKILNLYIDKNVDKLCNTHWRLLAKNPNSIPLLEQYPSNIFWKNLSSNPNGISLLEKNWEKIHWPKLSQNTNPIAIAWLEKNPDKIDWSRLSANPSAIFILEQNLDKIDWGQLSRNPSAIQLLEKNPKKINWKTLCDNTHPVAISWIEKNIKKCIVRWGRLSANPSAISIMEKYPEKIHWDKLMSNPSAIPFIEKNLDNIMYIDNRFFKPRMCFYSHAYKNPNIFPLYLKYMEYKKKTWLSDEESFMLAIPDAFSFLIVSNNNNFDDEYLHKSNVWEALCQNPDAFEYLNFGYILK
jgi:hypothetical protein